MQKKLALLCEKQLNAILLEADMAFKDIINAATTSLKLVDEINSDSRSFDKAGDADGTNQCKRIHDEMQTMLIKMQFHDEFSQRMHHVIKLCQLISEQDEETPESAQLNSMLLDRVVEIFSVSSEFSVLQAIFPEYRHERSDAAIELF